MFVSIYSDNDAEDNNNYNNIGADDDDDDDGNVYSTEIRDVITWMEVACLHPDGPAFSSPKSIIQTLIYRLSLRCSLQVPPGRVSLIEIPFLRKTLPQFKISKITSNTFRREPD